MTNAALSNPVVSVVIPTRGRSRLLRRAVESALRQTESNIEIVVVVDGADAESLTELCSIGDSRIRCITVETPVGGGEARNIGVRAARGRWVALLDDDDEWLPGKLSAQLGHTGPDDGDRVVVTSKFFVRHPERADAVRPRRLPATGEALSEFMFDYLCYFQTSTYLCTRDLLLAIPFPNNLRGFQDIDWFFRVVSATDVKLHVVPEPLSIYYAPEERTSVTSKFGWRDRLAWGQLNRSRMTGRAYSRFIAGSCAGRAAEERAGLKGLTVLLRESILRGKPSLISVALILGMFSIRPTVRRRVRDTVFLGTNRKGVAC